MEANTVSFGDPDLLWLVLIVTLPLILFLIWGWRKKQRLISAFIQASRLMTLTVGVSKSRQKAKLLMLVLATGLICFSVARPQWGESKQEVKESVIDVLLAVDTSKSMLANDAAPNRLVRAKLAALDLLRIGSPNRFGLIPFAGAAFLQSPLSLDEDALTQSLQSVDVGSVPQGGTVFANAIETAIDAFDKEENNQKILVIFTDGEDQEEGAAEAAAKAKKAGIKIFTVGIGTPEGELIRVKDDQNRLGYLKDESGNVVKSRLNETLLKQIAESTGGFYIPLSASGSMNALYEYLKQVSPSGTVTSRIISTRNEQYFWFVGLAILLLLLETFLPQQKRERKPVPAQGATAALLILLCLLGSCSTASASTTKAFESLKNGEYGKAADEFDRLSRNRTNDLRYPYDAGVAAYKMKEFNRAESYFNRAANSSNLELQQKSYYNLGNTHFQGGLGAEGKDRIAKWEQAVKDYEIALKIDPKDKDAASNADFVRKQLEELKKQEEQKQKQDSKQDDKDKKGKDKDKDQKGDDQKKKDEKQNNKDQKDPSKKDSDKKPNEKDEEKKNQNQDGKKPGDPKDKQNQSPESAKAAEDQKKREEEERAEQLSRTPQKMTADQAVQLLESLKGSQKPFPFTPMIQGRPTTKDW